MIGRLANIRNIFGNNQWLLVLSGWVLGILTIPLIEDFARIGAFIGDLVPEAVGILFTVLILDRLNEQRELEQLQNRLVREASGRANEASKLACDWMQFEGWLTGEASLLAGDKIWRANMVGVDLSSANLVNTDFYKSNLAGANLYRIDARNANFAYTDISGCDLVAANLEGANLEGANVEGVIWDHPNQSPAIMPDGKPWSAKTDMRRFTDYRHPVFWRSDDPESQAYTGMEEHWQRQRDKD